MGRSFVVDVNPKIIEWARESAGWSLEEISKKLKLPEEEYQKIESGEKNPTFKQLELMAEYFKRPLTVFFLPEPPKEKPITTYFRVLPKGKSVFSKELRFAIRKAQYLQSISKELMEDLGIDPKRKIEKRNLQEDPVKVAQEEREKIGISIEEQTKWRDPYTAFKNWRFAIESKNVFVFQFDFSVESARGFCLTEEDPPVIVINFKDDIRARIFTLFHEYAHVILGISEIYSEEMNNIDVENWCNTFAGEFLIPKKALEKDKDFLSFLRSKRLEPELFEKLSKRFKVSKRAMLTRLKTLNLIGEDEYKKELDKLEKPFPTKREGYLPPEKKCIQEKGKRFISIVLESKEKEIITTHDLVEYLSINLKYLKNLLGLITK
ncbi:MAG: ImmA/IrrE family metallo-endopeptidase [Aquificaceae bacterium]